MLILVFSICLLLLALGYLFYGKRLEKNLVVDPQKKMPSEELRDDIDYVPTPTPVLFGHHFSSIAGAGPIVGPIMAAAAFGWLPTLAWIIIGSIFIGAVHDYVASLASVNNRGMSIGQICRTVMSPLTYYILLIFLWLCLSYVIIVFLDLTAGTMTPPLVTGQPGVCENGSVATASILYIFLAIFYGLTVYKFKISFKKASLIFVPFVFIALYIGYKFPITGQLLSNIPASPKDFWLIMLIIYCFVASITPVWLLLQPRDYLSSFLLYSSLFVGSIGLILSGIMGKVNIEQPAFLAFSNKNLGTIFPALFITVACGAVSGFHSLVAAGTTAKQLKSKKSILPVVYGSMLVEAVLAVLSVSAVMIVSKIPAGALPTQTFANAFGIFASSCKINQNFGTVFAMLAINTFLLTTLDTCTRLTRFIIEEFISINFPFRRYITTILALIFPSALCFMKVDGKPAWDLVWPAFGTTNQLLAAITLLVVSVWLFKNGRKISFTIIPMIFMLITAGTSLVILAYSRISQGQNINDYIIGIISFIMLIITIILLYDSSKIFIKFLKNEL